LKRAQNKFDAKVKKIRSDNFDELSSYYSKSETLFLLSSMGGIESASSPLMTFGDWKQPK
jgi:hypothetical protein